MFVTTGTALKSLDKTMKTTLLLVPLLLLSACAAPVVPDEPPTEAGSLTECASDCEIFHGGYVRGCRNSLFRGINREEWEACMVEANTQLAVCYQKCEQGDGESP